jgi:hypothetical protein
MNRRDFLKISGLLSASLFIPFSPILISLSKNRPVELESGGMIFRGTPAGEIQTSRDGGRTWQLHTRLGSQYAIIDLYSDPSERVHATASFEGRSFGLLLSKDKKYWMTV